jgi:L-threonylcarbamoyladenylate synthase
LSLTLEIEGQAFYVRAKLSQMARIVPATQENIALAAKEILAGNLVAFPTETVYGLGANALDESAVAKIFAAKGRPATNPIIVHVAGIEGLEDLCATVPVNAYKLAEAFWPGPLTLVLPKSGLVPDIVTAGGATVGIRMPNHPVALGLIKASGVPIAAPSANRSEEISPTTAQHVADSLGDWIDLILDGGACDVGIESTVLDLSSDKPRILRPGQITAAQIEAVIGQSVEMAGESDEIARSPGQMPRHYAPRKPLRLGCLERQTNPQLLHIGGLSDEGANVASYGIGKEPGFYGRLIYSLLRKIDANPKVTKIWVEEPPDTPEWAAIRDRLKRAATPKE